MYFEPSRGRISLGESTRDYSLGMQATPTKKGLLKTEDRVMDAESCQSPNLEKDSIQSCNSRRKIRSSTTMELSTVNGRTRGWKSRPKMIELDDDSDFGFILKLPVYEKFFDQQLLLHVPKSQSEQRIILRSTVLGKTYHPVCTIVKRNAVTGSIEEMCHFAKPLHTDTKVNYIVGFLASNQKTADFVILIWLVLSTFGLVSRKTVSIRWMSTAMLDVILSMPTLEFVNALNRGVKGLHGFVFVRKTGSPRLRKKLTNLALKKYNLFNNEEDAENFLKSADQANLIGAADKHDFERSPYFNGELRNFLKLPINQKDSVDMYNYIHLQYMWATPNDATSPDQLVQILQPQTRRAWPVQGFIQDPDKAPDPEKPSVIKSKKKKKK